MEQAEGSMENVEQQRWEEAFSFHFSNIKDHPYNRIRALDSGIMIEFSADKWTQEEPWAPSGTGQNKTSAVRTGLVPSEEPWEGARGHWCHLACVPP